MRLVWWPMGNRLGAGNVGMVGMVAHGEQIRGRECWYGWYGGPWGTD